MQVLLWPDLCYDAPLHCWEATEACFVFRLVVGHLASLQLEICVELEPALHRQVCGWQEPDFRRFVEEPQCIAPAQPPSFSRDLKTLNGTLLRMVSCELMYGPLNCDFVWKGDNGCACP